MQTLSDLTSALDAALSSEPSNSEVLVRIISTIATVAASSQGREELNDALLDVLPLLMTAVLRDQSSNTYIELPVQSVIEEAVQHCPPRESFIAFMAAMDECLAVNKHARYAPVPTSLSFQSCLLLATGTSMLGVSRISRKTSFLDEYLELVNRWLRVQLTSLKQSQIVTVEDVLEVYSSGWKLAHSWGSRCALEVEKVCHAKKQTFLAAMEAVGLMTFAPEELKRADSVINGLELVEKSAMRPGSKLKHVRTGLDALLDAASSFLAQCCVLSDKSDFDTLLQFFSEGFQSTNGVPYPSVEIVCEGCAVTLCHELLTLSHATDLDAPCINIVSAISIESHLLPTTLTLMRAASRLGSVSLIALSLFTISRYAEFAGQKGIGTGAENDVAELNDLVQQVCKLIRFSLMPVLTMHPVELIRSCAHESIEALFDACSPPFRLALLELLLSEAAAPEDEKDNPQLVSMAALSLQRVRLEMASGRLNRAKAMQLARPWLDILLRSRNHDGYGCKPTTSSLLLARQADTVVAALSVLRLASAYGNGMRDCIVTPNDILRLKEIVGEWQGLEDFCCFDDSKGSELELALALTRLDHVIDQTLQALR
jgi:hypothetical protein